MLVILQQVRPDTTAYQLASFLAGELSLDIKLSDDVSPNAYFEFDPDEMTVCCSIEPIHKIALREAVCTKTAATHKVILEMANRETRWPEQIPQYVRYTTFCCLHEFGHLEQACDWGRAELEAAATQRDDLKARAREEAQVRADGGMSPQDVYSLLAKRYRDIPVEKDADERALRMLGLLMGDLHD